MYREYGIVIMSGGVDRRFKTVRVLYVFSKAGPADDRGRSELRRGLKGGESGGGGGFLKDLKKLSLGDFNCELDLIDVNSSSSGSPCDPSVVQRWLLLSLLEIVSSSTAP
jgi:hypothetical protein